MLYELGNAPCTVGYYPASVTFWAFSKSRECYRRPDTAFLVGPQHATFSCAAECLLC